MNTDLSNKLSQAASFFSSNEMNVKKPAADAVSTAETGVAEADGDQAINKQEDISIFYDRYAQYSKTEQESKPQWAKTAKNLPSLRFKDDYAKAQEESADNSSVNKFEIAAEKQDELDKMNEIIDEEVQKSEA